MDDCRQDEPFHVPQAQAYCRGEWSSWDPKITTPPGLSVSFVLMMQSMSLSIRRYILSVLLHRIFAFRCNLALLRFTATLTLISLPLFLTRLLAFHRRRRPPPFLAPSPEALVLSTFPIASFYGFLYYTEVPSLVSVLLTIMLATQHRHLSAAMVRHIAPAFQPLRVALISRS